MANSLSLSVLLTLALASAAVAARGRGWTGGEVKPGHYSIKEYHFHIYFRQKFDAEGNRTRILLFFYRGLQG
jgi:hypothetical protein